MSRKYGFEIEFGCRAHLGANTFPLLPCFYMGVDSSAYKGDLVGYELRGGIFNGFPMDPLKEVLGRIVKKGGFPHDTCGFHIHFSGWGQIDLLKLQDELRNKYNWGSRSKWCGQGNLTTLKYLPARHIEGDHYEIRCFNSSLNVRALHQMWKIAEKAIARNVVAV